jgi:hypothetical protein
MTLNLTIDDTPMHVHRLWDWHPAGAITILDHVWLKGHFFANDFEINIDGRTLLRHEAQHIRDQRTYHVLYWLSYVGLIIGPLSLRGLWEWRAYKITMKAWHERGIPLNTHNLDLLVGYLCAPMYLWAMTRSHARRLVYDEAQRLQNEPRPPV